MVLVMNILRGYKLHVLLNASRVRKRLKGYGFGVRKVETAGIGEAVIIHTATGKHLEDLRALFGDVLPPAPPPTPADDHLEWDTSTFPE